MTVAGTAARYRREMDRLAVGQDSISLGPIDPSPILGVWWNTNHSTWGISRAELTRRDDRVWVRVIAADPAGGPHDWGEAEVEEVYTDDPQSGRVCGYRATFDLGHARTQLQANMNHGLTVIAAFTTFTDDSGRLGYLSREFFHRRK